jgi:hypothetical protein
VSGPSIESESERLDRLEREHAEQIARAHDALAAAQDRSYWLDRWNLDLNELMRRRGASELRAALRGARQVVRFARKARGRLARVPEEVRKARRDVEP